MPSTPYWSNNVSNSTETAGQLVHPNATRPSFRQFIENALSDSAQAWSVSKTWIVAILITPALVGASGLAAAFAGKGIYKLYTEEDGVAEYAQALLYGACFIMSMLVMRYQSRAKNQLTAVLYFLLACGLFFMVGEELSWGQRIFGWATPETLESINKQEETNLHNIYGVGSTFKWVQGLVGAYGTFLPLLLLWRPNSFRNYRQLLDAIVPHYTLIVFFFPMFVWRLYRNLADDPVRYYYVITNYNEIIELILAIGFCLFLSFQLRKCRREAGNLVAV
jgi:hypothetical protein